MHRNHYECLRGLPIPPIAVCSKHPLRPPIQDIVYTMKVVMIFSGSWLNSTSSER